MTGLPRSSPGAIDAPAGPVPRGPGPISDDNAVQTGMAIDRDRRLVNLQLTYTAAATIAVAVLTVVALAYLAGQKSGLTPRTAYAGRTTPEIQDGPIERGVLEDLPPTRVLPRDDDPAVRDAGGGEGQSGTTNPAERVRREGYNYVIIQSYPEKDMAEGALAALKRSGIDASIEQRLARLSAAHAKWYVVVGFEPFSRISNNPDFTAYLNRVMQVSKKYSNRDTFRAFDPMAYKWGKGDPGVR